MTIEYLLGLLILIFPSAIAWNFIEILDRERVLTVLEKLPLAYMIGLGIVAWGMLVLQLIGKPFSPLWLLTPLLGASILSILNSGRRKRYLRTPFQSQSLWLRERWSKAEILLLTGIGLELGFAFTRALLLPMEDFDAVGNWGLKAKAIYLANTVPFSFLGNHDYITAHPDYPLLLPLVESFVYFFLGHLNDFVVKWIFPLSLTACVIALYASLRRMTLDRTACMAFTFILVSIPHFVFNATTAYSDIIVASYFGMGFFCLFLWIRQRNELFLGLSALLTGMAGLTKNEGLVLCLVNLVVLALAEGAEKPFHYSDYWRRILFYAGILMAVLMPWLAFRMTIETPNDLFNQKNLESAFQWETFSRVKTILYYYQSHLFNIKNWNLLWLAGLGLLLFCFRRVIQSDQKYILLATAMTFSIYTAAYFVTSYDVAWHLRTSVSRLMVHVVPLVVFGFACAYLDSAHQE